MPSIRKSKQEPKQAKPAKNANTICTIYDDSTIGTVQISEDVIATIAAIAATDVEGVASVGGGITREKAASMSARSIAKGVKVEITEEKKVIIRIILIVTYGSSIPETTIKAQQKIRTTVETMTGLTVEDVHVSVADVALDTK